MDSVPASSGAAVRVVLGVPLSALLAGSIPPPGPGGARWYAALDQPVGNS